MAELKPWQRLIKNESDVKPNEFANYIRGVGLVAADMKHPMYIANKKRKEGIKQEKAKLLREKIIARIKKGEEKGYKKGQKDFKKTDKFKKLVEQAYQKGLKDGKPAMGKINRVASLKAKADELMRKAKALENS